MLALGLGWPAPAIATTALHYDELTFPPLGEIEIPEFERYQLDNGLVVYLMEDHELPLVQGSATFSTGSRFEPVGKVGLASILGDAIRLGGTQTHSPDDVNQLLEQRAASVETEVGDTTGSASFNVLTEDLPEVFTLFADVIRNPAFDADRIDFLKNQNRGAIARRNDDPDDITRREFRKLVYGTESPYARTIEYDTLDAISRDDILAFYQASIRPERTILGIVGDFDPEAMKSLIEELFGDWQPAASDAVTFDLPEVAQAQAGVFLVDQPQLTQSSVQIGHLGGQLSSPDHGNMAVLNEVLNGFGGRLFNELRSRQGLAYVVYAFWAPRYDYPGTFIGGGQTSSETTVPFIQAFLSELEKVRTAPVSAAELQFAKDAVLNSFVFNFQSPEQTLSRLIRYEYYDYPSDFVFRFQQDVENATIEGVLRAAQENLKPEQLVTLVVGNEAEIEPPLSALGPDVTVTQIDVSIPEPSA
ncbi:MAG: pitrilysin family protein [Cyanobacteria bacterium P01_A01_bin.123]